MINVIILDENGFYVREDEKKEDELQSINYTTVPITVRYVKSLFNGVNWVEGATQEEIKAWEESKPKSSSDETTIRLEQIEQAIGILATQQAKNILLQNQGGI